MSNASLLSMPKAEKKLSLSDIKVPYVLKNKLLMAPGYWHGSPVPAKYTRDELNLAFKRTIWNDRSCSLFLDHQDKKAREWIGYISNQMQDEANGYTYGDLNIIDPIQALKLELGARLGISPNITGRLNANQEVVNGFFSNFSLVYEPACRMTFLNEESSSELGELLPNFTLSEEVTTMDGELARVTGMETKRKELGMSPAEFYAAPRDPPSSSALPIFDEAHTRNAMARFNQTQFESDSEKASARRKILSKAKSYGIDTSGFEENKLSEEVSLEMAEEKKIDATAIDYGKVADAVARKLADEAEAKALEEKKAAEEEARKAEVNAIVRERDELKAKMLKMEEEKRIAEEAKTAAAQAATTQGTAATTAAQGEVAKPATHVVTASTAQMAPPMTGDSVRDADVEMLNWFRAKDGLPPARFV